MKDVLRAVDVRRGPVTGAVDEVVLSYDARLVRRKRLTGSGGIVFVVDLPETVSLNAGDGLVLSDGRVVAVAAAREDLLEVTGDLVRLAWHIGNRHTPCQIEADRLVIQRDPVLAKMLAGLDGTVREVFAPFTPEGGAYGHGRTMGHDHGPEQAHSHVHHHGGHGYSDDDSDAEMDL